jgi:Tol biopolymer transport system component
MSPEQASAQPLDHRTDIFSLGVMLYEMLAGKRPFHGKSQVDTMHAIIHDPAPPLTRQPPELRDILTKALAKDTRDRYQHAGDLGLDLRYFQRAWESHSLPSMGSAVASTPNRRWLATVCLAMVLVAAVSAGAGWIWRSAMAPIENPLANAKFARFTDFEGIERDAAISPDGKFVAFVSDHEGPLDIWMSQVGTGRFVNLTQGKVPNLHSMPRVVGFSGDGTEIWFHDAIPPSPLMTLPLMGGPPRIFLGKSPAKTAPINAAWSPDGGHLVYHTSDPGDPMFVTDRTGGNAHQIYVDRPGIHNHHPVWSPDGAWIFFMKGSPATGEMDMWRIAPGGGTPERMTRHNAGVGYPSPIDARTVVYVGRDADGSGPWLWALDTKRKVTRRVSFGLEKYTSLSASADGRRLAATVTNPSASLWSLPILDRAAGEGDAKPFPVPMVRALAPRFRGESLFYLSSRGTGDGLWRYRDGRALEIWKGSEGGLIEPAAISADGLGVALVLRRNGKVRLHTITADGSELQPIAEAIEVKGAADWSPDGKWIVTGGEDAKGEGLFKIPVSGGTPVRLVEGPFLNPVWSPDGSLIVYTGANVSSEAPLLAVRPDGTRVELPGIQVRREGQRVRFTPNGKSLVFMRGLTAWQDFWLLDLTTNKTRLLAHLNNTGAMLTFDVTPDGKQIVFDRLQENSDIVLIDLPAGTSVP